MTAHLSTLRIRLDVAETRLDAARRRCTTGYGCGSSCISVKKECRSEGGAATSKERIQRLEQLSKGEIKPRGLGVPKSADAAAMAESLRSARGNKAQALLGERRVARKAKAAEEAAKATKAKEAASNQGAKASKGSNPRAEAETVEGSGDYEFARKSDVQNAGEDIALSARHRRNLFRTLEEAEASGEVEKLLTRDNLMKNFPTDLVSGVDASNVLSRLEAHYCLKAFPNMSAKDVASYVEAADGRSARGERAYGNRILEEVDAKTVRKQYFQAFQTIRALVEDNKGKEPGELRKMLSSAVVQMIGTLRKQEGMGYSRTYSDPYNPVANTLVDMQKRLVKRGSSSVAGQMDEFAKTLRSAGGGSFGDAKTTMGLALDAASKIMEGSTLAAAFGKDGEGKKRFNSADLYVAPAKRSGGRSVGGTAQAATDEIINRIGFRGLQYGNSVTDDERRHHVQKAAEAMVDLADMTGLPDKAISLNGTLALAIGARGKGTAMAHYEPSLKVINLTRKKGVGTLAHEWAHALDNYAAGGSKSGSFLSTGVGSPELRQAMNEVKASWEKSGYTRQVYAALRELKLSGLGISADYWTSHEEMFARSFEAYTQFKLAAAGRQNSYLTQSTGHPLWPSKAQAEEMAPHFDALMSRIKTERFPGESNRRDSRDERIWRFIHAMGV